ncbi:2OG-Fe(II) oxygenase [Acidocella sp.]|uniref:2OG-Fe(II) oxygenase family protein n=1 Tax=Acidocella sp. TaxID=50710 RepID=UPI003D066D3A
MPILDIQAFRRTTLNTAPFKHLVVKDFIASGQADAALRDFPAIEHAGLLPVEATKPGPVIKGLVDELTRPELTAAFSEKFGIDLTGRPTMITIRGRAQERDGRIHTDSEAKLVTALLYFNKDWQDQGGRLRLLRSGTDLNDMITEVPPALGTLVAFQRTHNSFHGHEPYVGVRRYIMINWMAGSLAAQRELMRHRLSAQAKKLLNYA